MTSWKTFRRLGSGLLLLGLGVALGAGLGHRAGRTGAVPSSLDCRTGAAGSLAALAPADGQPSCAWVTVAAERDPREEDTND